MTVNEITTGIAKALGMEDDFTFKRTLLKNIDTWRATLIEQTLERTPGDRKFYSKPMFIDMVPYNTIEGIDIVSMTRSTLAVPDTLGPNSCAYDYIGSIDGYTPFGVYVMGTERYLRSGFRPPSYCREGDGHIITTSKDIKKIKAIGIPADPEAWFMFNCTTGDCDYWNSEYPVTEKVAQRIMQSVLSVDYRRLLPSNTPEVKVEP